MAVMTPHAVRQPHDGHWMVRRPIPFTAGGHTGHVPVGFVFWATVGPTRRWNARAVAIHDWLHKHKPSGVTADDAARAGYVALKEDGAPKWYRAAWLAFWKSGLFWLGWIAGIR